MRPITLLGMQRCITKVHPYKFIRILVAALHPPTQQRLHCIPQGSSGSTALPKAAVAALHPPRQQRIHCIPTEAPAARHHCIPQGSSGSTASPEAAAAALHPPAAAETVRSPYQVMGIKRDRSSKDAAPPD